MNTKYVIGGAVAVGAAAIIYYGQEEKKEDIGIIQSSGNLIYKMYVDPVVIFFENFATAVKKIFELDITLIGNFYEMAIQYGSFTFYLQFPKFIIDKLLAYNKIKNLVNNLYSGNIIKVTESLKSLEKEDIDDEFVRDIKGLTQDILSLSENLNKRQEKEEKGNFAPRTIITGKTLDLDVGMFIKPPEETIEIEEKTKNLQQVKQKAESLIEHKLSDILINSDPQIDKGKTENEINEKLKEEGAKVRVELTRKDPNEEVIGNLVTQWNEILNILKKMKEVDNQGANFSNLTSTQQKYLRQVRNTKTFDDIVRTIIKENIFIDFILRDWNNWQEIDLKQKENESIEDFKNRISNVIYNYKKFLNDIFIHFSNIGPSVTYEDVLIIQSYLKILQKGKRFFKLN